jgi:glycerol-3-phosphate cytidylyltransferase
MKVGFTAGAFDLFHPGQVLFLANCKKYCDYLIVGLHVNPHVERPAKHTPIQSLLERQIQLKGCRYVDEIIIYDTEADLDIILGNFEINIRFLGEDYLPNKVPPMPVTGRNLVPIKYIARNHNFSSTSLRERIKNAK